MAKHRPRGVFDPDYRRKGWNQSYFAPKNGTPSISQLSLILVLLPFIGLYFVPEIQHRLLTLQGLVISITTVFILWPIVAILIRGAAWRSIQRKLDSNNETKASTSTRDKLQLESKADSQSQNKASDNEDPIQEQLSTRKKRLTGQISTANMNPRDFEHEVAWVINALTPQKAIVCGGSGDGGIDINVYSQDKLVGIIQCKRFNPKRSLPPQHVRELAAVKQQAGVNTAYLVTTSHFTKRTRREAKDLGIRLIDGQKLEEMRRRAKAQVHM